MQLSFNPGLTLTSFRKTQQSSWHAIISITKNKSIKGMFRKSYPKLVLNKCILDYSQTKNNSCSLYRNKVDALLSDNFQIETRKWRADMEETAKS